MQDLPSLVEAPLRQRLLAQNPGSHERHIQSAQGVDGMRQHRRVTLRVVQVHHLDVHIPRPARSHVRRHRLQSPRVPAHKVEVVAAVRPKPAARLGNA